MKLFEGKTWGRVIAARDAAERESSCAAGMPPGSRQHDESDATSMAASRRARASGYPRRLWTREDGFTMSGTRLA